MRINIGVAVIDIDVETFSYHRCKQVSAKRKKIMESAEFSSTSIEDWSPTMDQEINFTANNSAANNSSRGLSVWMAFNISLYALICGAGMIGNGLVIYVVLRCISDICFLKFKRLIHFDGHVWLWAPCGV
jgi:hypothetical protein